MQLDCQEIGMKMAILKKPGGQSLDKEWELLPFSEGPPVHIHPHAVETYEILEGEMEFYVGGVWQKAGKGDIVRVEKGQPHTFRNHSGQSVHLLNSHQPAMNFEGFFRGLHTFSKSGLVKNGRMSMKAIMGISTLYNNYPDEIVAVSPPAFVMKVMGTLGRWAGLNFK